MARYKYYLEVDGNLTKLYRVNQANQLYSSWDRRINDFYNEEENRECGKFTIYSTPSLCQAELSKALAYAVGKIINAADMYQAIRDLI